MISLCWDRLPDCSKKSQMTLKVLNSAMIDCSKLCKRMQQIHRSFSSVTTNPNHSWLWNIAVKGNRTSNANNILRNFQFLDDTGRVANSVMLTQLATHPEELLATYLKGWCWVFRTLHVGRHWTLGQRGAQREKKKCVCHVLGDIHTNLVHTGLQSHPRDRPPT